MSNISGKLNLRQLKSKMMEKNGIKYLVIPVKENHLFEGEKGVYLDFQGWELKERKSDSKDTHLIKQSLPKDIFSKISDDEKKSMPVLGNLIQWGATHSEPEVREFSSETPVDTDDLPF